MIATIKIISSRQHTYWLLNLILLTSLLNSHIFCACVMIHEYMHHWHWGYAVAELVTALCYKPEGRGFESRRCGIFQFA
jgi:hypothetical protein